MDDFIATCDHIAEDKLLLRKRLDWDQIEVENKACDITTCNILSEYDAERLYEWLGQALGKHHAGVKG